MIVYRMEFVKTSGPAHGIVTKTRSGQGGGRQWCGGGQWVGNGGGRCGGWGGGCQGVVGGGVSRCHLIDWLPRLWLLH